jgi:hypothetical protein
VVNSYQVSLYGGQFFKNKTFWDGSAGLAWNQYRSSRSIPSVYQTANANYDGQNYFGRLRGGIAYKKIRESNFDFIPEISTTFMQIMRSGYTERNADTLSLQVRRNASQFLEGRVGFNLNYGEASRDKSSKKYYRSHFSYGHNFLNKRQKIVSNFIGQNSTFTTYSEVGNGSIFRVGLGADIYKAKSTTLALDYVYDFSSNFASHSAMFKFLKEF